MSGKPEADGPLSPEGMANLEKGAKKVKFHFENKIDLFGRDFAKDKKSRFGSVFEHANAQRRSLTIFFLVVVLVLYVACQNNGPYIQPLEYYYGYSLPSVDNDVDSNKLTDEPIEAIKPIESFIDKFWSTDRNHLNIANYSKDIKDICSAEVIKNPEEFRFHGQTARGEKKNRLVFVVHHKTGTHLLRNIQNDLLNLAGLDEQPVGECHGFDLPQRIKWARRTEFWCKYVLRQNILYPLWKKGNRLVNLARHPRNMLISQHVYQKALQDAKLSFSDTIHNMDHKYFRGLRRNNSILAWEGTMEIMMPVITDMLKHMKKTIGDEEVMTVEMESHFYKDFDGTIKQIYYHLLGDKISAQSLCELRLKASFQDVKRFGAAVDDSHASTHVASKDNKVKAKLELDEVLSCQETRCLKFQKSYNKWVNAYEELSKQLWKF